MTELERKFLAHLVWMASLEKHYAWWAAKNYAQCPGLERMPQLLTEAMREAKLRDEERQGSRGRSDQQADERLGLQGVTNAQQIRSRLGAGAGRKGASNG